MTVSSIAGRLIVARLMTTPTRWSFTLKAGLALALCALADVLLFEVAAGSVLGLCALAWAAATVVGQPVMRRSRTSWIALSLATALALVLVFDPSLLAWVMFWGALSVAVLAPRSVAFGDAWQWFRRLLFHGLVSPFGPLMDWMRLRRLVKRRGGVSIARHLPTLLLPALGGTAFLLLFAIANPLISNWLEQLHVPSPDFRTILRALFWGAMLITVWASLRPRRFRMRFERLEQGSAVDLPGVTLASVTLSLILFNALFAVQNALDIAILWGGQGLPQGMTLAEYAHRGAYPLIVTALLAGMFVLLTTQPGSPMAASKLVRTLVGLWTAQNVFLVASSMLRTMDYVEAYSMTVLRISALLWMALVALGLILIAVRLMRGRTSAWLVNCNAAAALVLLGGCTLVDLGTVAARWKVGHAREVTGQGTALDLCYLDRLGGSALLPLVAFELNPGVDAEKRARATRVRHDLVETLKFEQADWRSWEARTALRLARLPANLPVPAPTDPRVDPCYDLAAVYHD